MKKILLSIGSIVFVVALLAGGTGAFLNDTEKSTGNTFASGIIDLKVDNESYVTDEWGNLVFSTSTSWSLSGLSGKFFFNFPDIKPGDIGEDTISLHVNNNNAYVCMEVVLTGTPENGVNEPEALLDETVGENEGELQNEMNFAFWADDGDNVYESGESIFKQGLVKDLFDGKPWTIADSQKSIWFTSPQPIPGGYTKYIGKAWCFGEMDTAALSQDGKGKIGNLPAQAGNGPLVRGTGFTCVGEEVDNALQSDGITADVTFTAVQSRGNSQFKCEGGATSQPELKTLFSDNFESGVVGQDINPTNTVKWTEQGGASVEWGLDGKVAHLDDVESVTSKSIDMSIYHDITLKYGRMTDDSSGPVNNQTLTVEYSVDGGSSWNILETVNGESNWTNKTWSLSPLADNKANVKIKFSLVGQNNTNHAYIDNVSITGITP